MTHLNGCQNPIEEGQKNHKCVKFTSISHRQMSSDDMFFRMDWLVGNAVDCLFRGNQTLTPFVSKPLKESNGNESDKNLETKGTHPPNQDPILGTVMGVTDEWGQGVWGKHIPAGGSSATPTPHLLGLLFFFYPFMSHTTSVMTQYTNSMVAPLPPPPPPRFFLYSQQLFPTPTYTPGAKRANLLPASCLIVQRQSHSRGG